MNATTMKRRARISVSSLVVAGALSALAIGLGANSNLAQPDKQAMHERMLEIGQAFDALRSQQGAGAANRDMSNLLSEYTRLSLAMGGDDPANLLGGAGSAGGGQTMDEGGIASAPPPPPGCTSASNTFTNSTPVAMPTADPVNPLVTSTITVSGLDSFLWDVDLTTFISHPAASELDMTLTSPAGTIVTISTDNGGTNDNVYNGTVWDDDADPGSQVPYATQPPFVNIASDRTYAANTLASPLVPEEAMAAFFGEDPNGVWTLTISDDATGLSPSHGSLDSWALNITTALSAPVTTTTSVANVTPVAIPTTAPPNVVTSVITIAGADPVLTDVNISTTIAHTQGDNLDITVQSPAGTIVTLTTDNGATNDDVFNGTLWDDDADPGNQVPYASPLATSNLVTDTTYANLTAETTLVPEEALGAFIGEDPNGDWTLTISDDATSNGGSLNAWSVDVTATTAVPALAATFFNNTTPVVIDPSPTIFTSTLDVSGAGTYLWDLDVTTFITHTFPGDLDITLRSPAGTIVTLVTDSSASGDDNVYNGTLWDDDADPGNQVPYASPLAASNLVTDTDYTANSVETTLVGEEALAAYIGEDPNGTWTLTIHDDGATLDGGSLDSWSLAVTALDAAPTNASPVSAANATPAVIEDDAPPNVVSSTVEVTGADTFLCDVNLSVNITHTFSGDLDFTLMSPAGTIVTISTDNGGGFDNSFAGTTFDDDADPNGQVPQFNNPGSVTDHPYVDLTVVASLTSEEALGAFIGEDPNGTWTLTISDDANADGGMLNSWSIDVVTCACEEPPVCEGDTDDSGAVDVDDLVNVILAWGACRNCPPDPCAADVFPFPAGDCNVNVDDLVSVVLNWGECP